MSVYEEVEIEDLDFDPKEQVYTYQCPCGDLFRIHLEDMWDVGEDIATCPSCTLRVRVIYDEEDLPPLREEDESDGEEGDEDDGDDDDGEVINKKMTTTSNEKKSGDTSGSTSVGDVTSKLGKVGLGQ